MFIKTHYFCRMIQKSYSLQELNTFGIPAIADGFAAFDSVETLRELLNHRGEYEQLLILGGGSNILFTKDVHALVLRNEIKGIDVLSDEGTTVIVKVGAGVVWHDFVLHAVENGWGGIENLSLIPGSVGASPMQNIGAYGVEIKDVFHSLEALHIESQTIKTFTKEECNFGYRESVYKRELKNQ